MIDITEFDPVSCENEEPKYEKTNKIPDIIENPDDTTSDIEKDIIYRDNRDEIVGSKSVKLVTVFDVASFILKKMGTMTTMKLQKLIYYCQAWSLVWDEKPIFYENIEAWANGPVVRELYNYHRGWYAISSVQLGNSDVLDAMQIDTIESVLEYYGSKPSQWLSDLTHMEEPWKICRKGMAEQERGSKVITHDVLAEYYGSL